MTWLYVLVGIQFFVLGKPMATLVVQLGGLCIATALIVTGVRGLRSGKDLGGEPTSKWTSIGCLVTGALVALASFFAGQLMFPEG